MDSFGEKLFPIAVMIAGPVIDNLSIYYVGIAKVIGIILMTLIIYTNKYIRELK